MERASMSTEDGIFGGLPRSEPHELTDVGGVRLGAGMKLRLSGEDYYYGEWPGEATPILFEITFVVGIKDDTHVVLYGYAHSSRRVSAKAIAVEISALADALL
jgi:hypothetical protein